ncbi:hypothetical protein V6N13_125781 [Hibiscus sabdariffa]|uniref:Uncharacterized protein n=1 Tax=Hibiscus sabdariffa TaxID=183260 RepID=A0ABR2U6W8_9ROSI
MGRWMTGYLTRNINWQQQVSSIRIKIPDRGCGIQERRQAVAERLVRWRNTFPEDVFYCYELELNNTWDLS